MKKESLFKCWTFISLLAVLNLSACAFLPMPSIPQQKQVSLRQNALSVTEQRQQQLWQEFQRKPAYVNAPQVMIETDLLNTDTKHPRHVDISKRLNLQSFSIQALPQGALVFQEVFTKNTNNFEFARGFRVPDTSKRYTIHIEKVNPTSNNQIQINLNGNNYLANHFNWQQKNEWQSSGLLLNANNSLRVRLQGKNQTGFTISIVETGEAGTILKRRGKLGKPGENQATHVHQNDTNIFIPNDLSSLGGLQPYEGQLQDPDAPSNVTGVSVDNQPAYAFESGRLVLRLNQPEIILPILQSKYGAVVVNQTEIPNHPELTYYYVEFDLNKSPITNTISLIEAYRTRIPAEFNSFKFASLSGLQTFVILMDLMVNHEEYIATWELNTYTPTPAITPVLPKDWNNQAFNPLPPTYSATPSPLPTGVLTEDTNNRGWWLKNTFLPEAWNYSIGTGVNAAYIDKGFRDILHRNNTPVAELGRRLKSDFSNETQNIVLAIGHSGVLPDKDNRLGCTLVENDYCKGYHGSVTMMAGFGERDNNLGTSGSSPDANVIPFAIDGFPHSYAKALIQIATDHIAGKKYDVIGFNQQEGFPRNWTPTWAPTPGLDKDPYYFTLHRAAFHLVSDLDIPIVVPAGNANSRCSGPAKSAIISRMDLSGTCLLDNAPTMYDGEKSIFSGKTVNLIIAGGASRDGTKAQSNAHPNPTGDILSWSHLRQQPTAYPAGAGSTIGKGFIWTPARVEIYDLGLTQPKANLLAPTVNIGEGTSYACPTLTGIVALMKSRNPYLTVNEIETILQSSKTKIDITHEAPPPSTAITNLTASDYVNQPFVDAWDAVEQAIGKRPIGSNTPADYEAKPYFALVEDFDATKILFFNKLSQSSATDDQQRKTALRTVADNIWNTNLAKGQLVKVKGWSGIDAGREPIGNHQLEILDVQPICNLATCPSPLPSSVSAWFQPEISSLTQSNVVSDPSYPTQRSFDLEFTGKDLVANLLTGKEAERFRLKLQPASPPGSAFLPDVLIHQNQILDIANDGSGLKIHFNPGQIATGTYNIVIVGAAGKDSQLFKGSGSGFGITSEGGGVTLVGTDEPNPLPPRAYVWLTRDGREKPVQAGQMIGMGINAAALEQLQITIDGRDIPIREFVQQTESNGYVLFQVPHDLEPGVKDMILSLAGNQFTFEQAIKILAMPNPVEIQQLPTTGGFGIDHSGINGDIYLGISNRREGDDFSVDSEVFKWDGSLFNYFQSIATVTGSDMEFFELNGERYLAVANASGGFSKLYQWNGSQFVPVQDLRSGLNALKHIEFNGQHFLFGSGDSTLTPVAYRWNGSLFQAIQSGDLLNIGFTEHVDAFQIGTTLYAVFGVTTTSTSSSPHTNSRILQWTGSRFVHTQTIPTVRAQGVEAFEMNGETYLAIANHGPINDNQADSTIYKWNGSQFNSIQSVATRSGHSWKHFHSEGVDYLALAEGGNPARFFYWDGTQFVHFRTIEHLGFWEFDFVDTGLKRLLVGSFYGEGTTFLEPSYVYEFR